MKATVLQHAEARVARCGWHGQQGVWQASRASSSGGGCQARPWHLWPTATSATTGGAALPVPRVCLPDGVAPGDGIYEAGAHAKA